MTLHGLPAVRRDAGSSSQDLRVAQDAVQRRAQFVADGGDVAALGVVGLPRRFAWPVCSAASVRRWDSISRISSVGLAVGFLLRHLPALVRPAPATRRRCRPPAAAPEGACRKAVADAAGAGASAAAPRAPAPPGGRAGRTAAPAAARSRHQQQEMAQAGFEVGPHAPRAAAARSRPAIAPTGCACGLQRSSQRASSVQHSEQIAPLIGRAVRHVLGLRSRARRCSSVHRLARRRLRPGVGRARAPGSSGRLGRPGDQRRGRRAPRPAR